MARETKDQRANRARAILRRLKKARPDARLELEFSSPLELLVATVLAAQATDKRVNEVTRDLFRRYPTAQDYAGADLHRLQGEIKPTGFYRKKAEALIAIGRQLAEQHGGQVPDTMEALLALRGVARKTANMVLGSAMGIAAGVVVDTHVARVAPRMGLTRQKTPEKIEQDLMTLLPRKDWIAFGVHGTLHGRYVCVARKPHCSACPVAGLCPRVDVTNAQ